MAWGTPEYTTDRTTQGGPLFGREPIYTKVPTGLYGYDIQAEERGQQIGQARRESEARPVHGAGGISGAALRQRGDMEASFLDASIRSIERRRAEEMQRKQREAAIREQRALMTQKQENQNLTNLLTGITGIGQSVGTQATGLANATFTPEGLGGEEKVLDLLNRGLIRPTEGGLYQYTPQGGAQQFFSQPYWGTGV